MPEQHGFRSAARILAVLSAVFLTSCSWREESSEPETPPRPRYPLQDNPLAGCSLCHVDIEDEFVVSKHFDEKIGCKTCHGPSEEHLADENNEVKPDELFARSDVDRLCGVCHDCGREEERQPTPGREGEPEVCTDCHGPHDLARRQGRR
jgi:hypothetical protein